METLELKGFTKAYKTDTELALHRHWGGRIIYVVPLVFGILMLSQGIMAISILIFALPFFYLGAAGVFNNVIFTFDNRGLTIQNKPIPWFIPADRTIPRAEIKRVLIKEVRQSSSRSYDVYVEFTNEQSFLIQACDSSSEANKLSSVILDFINKL